MSKLLVSTVLVSFSINGFASIIPIHSCQELQSIRDLTASYELVGAQIDCTGIDFQPIGGFHDQFRGQFNGNKVPIIGLNIQQEHADFVGLFGATGEDAIITNTTIVDAVVSGGSEVGILLGRANFYPSAQGATITNNTVSGSVSGTYGVGGLIGSVSSSQEGTVLQDNKVQNLKMNSPKNDLLGAGGLVGVASHVDIEHCIAEGIITTNSGHNIGGLVGAIFVLFPQDESIIANSSSQTTITAPSATYVGGLLGAFEAFRLLDEGKSMAIEDSYAIAHIQANEYFGGLIGAAYGGMSDMSVVRSYAKGSIRGEIVAGGLVGIADELSIAESYSDVDVNVVREYAGGIAGKFSDGQISNAYATGNVSGAAFVGGMVGSLINATISNSYATGRVISNNPTPLQGGLVGESAGTIVIEDSFWDIGTTGQRSSDGGGLGMKTYQLQTQAFYEGYGWDFDTIWAPITTPQYPELQ